MRKIIVTHTTTQLNISGTQLSFLTATVLHSNNLFKTFFETLLLTKLSNKIWLNQTDQFQRRCWKLRRFHLVTDEDMRRAMNKSFEHLHNLQILDMGSNRLRVMENLENF